MKNKTRPFAITFGLATALLAAQPATAGQLYTIWDSASAQAAHGTIGGTISVNVSASDTGISFPSRVSSSTFGTFNGTQSVTDVYGSGLPGTNDFLNSVNGSNATTVTVSFSQAVQNPIFYVYNLDFRDFQFANGINPVVLAGSLNLVAAGNVVGSTHPTLFDNGILSDPNKGNANGSAYGSFQLLGTFTSLTYTRPLGDVGAFNSDGTALEISVSVPEPAALPLFGIGAAAFLAQARRRRKQSV